MSPTLALFYTPYADWIYTGTPEKDFRASALSCW